MVEPSNTISNLSYLIIAILVLRFLKQDPFKAKLFSFAMTFLFVGSWFFHMTLSYEGQWMDLMGMYYVVGFLILSHLQADLNFSNKSFLIHYFLWTSLMGAIIIWLPETRRWIFGAMIATTFALGLKQLFAKKLAFNKGLYFVAIGAFFFALGAWLIDVHKIICSPYHWLNGHSVWHLMVGVSCYYYFKFLLTLKNKKHTSPLSKLAHTVP
jgi:hypothetical protein